MTNRLRPALLARYAAGSLGTGGFGVLPGLVLVYYLTDVLGVAALWAGVLVAVAKIWDVVINPAIGRSSDYARAAHGSRRRFLIIGAAVLPLAFIGMFIAPVDAGPTTAGLWVLGAFLMAALGFSLFQVPYLALPAEITPSYTERSRLVGWRVVALTLAILIFGGVGPALRNLGETEVQGYAVMAVICAVVIAVGMALAVPSAPRTAPVADATRTSLMGAYRDAVVGLKRSRPFRVLFLTFVIQAIAVGLMLAGAQYVATWLLASEDAVTYLFVAMVAPALFVAPAWAALANRIGKRTSFTIASGLFLAAAVGMVPLAWAAGWWVLLPTALVGIAYAGLQTLPLSMLPDVITVDAKTHGTDEAGGFAGTWTAGETAGMAFGSTVLTIVLAVTGYIESTAGETAVQPDTALTGIAIAFSIVPAVLAALSFIPLSRYRVARSDIEEGHPADHG